MKKCFLAFLAAVVFATGVYGMPLKVRAASYATEWWLWNQTKSDYADMRDYGCRVVAFAKMLKEAGLYGYENPDGLYNWGKKNGLFVNGISESGSFGNLLVQYLKTQNVTAVDKYPSGTKQAITVAVNDDGACQLIMDLINQGYYVFLKRVDGGIFHTVYIGREASLKEGTPIVMEWSGGVKYKDYKYKNETYWYLHAFTLSGKEPVSSGTGGAGSPGAGAVANKDPIIFNNVTQSNITENTAFLKTDVTADCSGLTDVGLDWGYVVNGCNQPMTGFNWKVGTGLNYISVDFGKEKDTSGNVPYLEPGKTVYYKFYATRNDGIRIYSSPNYHTFQTAPCSHDWWEISRKEATSAEDGVIMYECVKCHDKKPEYIPQKEPPVETGDGWDEGTGAVVEDSIRFDSIAASNITATTAFIKADVTADCSRLSAVGVEWGYIIDETERPQTEFNWKTGTYLTFISVDFGKEKDKNGDIPVLDPGKVVYYRFFADEKSGDRVYSDTNRFMIEGAQKEEAPSRTEESETSCITFDTNTVSNITSNTAFVKAAVTADCTKLSAAGMEWGYVLNNAEVPRTEFNWRTGTYLTFISVDFGREVDRSGGVPTLEAGRMVYYRFFGEKKDGSRIYSDTKYFETANVQRENPSENTENTGADCITFDTVNVSNVTSSTAFVKTTVTADCSKLRAAGMEWGYLTDGAQIPRAEFRWNTGTYLTFISIEFGDEIDCNGEVPQLEAGKIVYYRFFGEKKDGCRVYSDTGLFTT